MFIPYEKCCKCGNDVKPTKQGGMRCVCCGYVYISSYDLPLQYNNKSLEIIPDLFYRGKS